MVLKNRNWIKQLNDESLDKLINKNISLKKISKDLDRKIYNMFENPEILINNKLKKYNYNIFGNKYLKFSFSFVIIVLFIISNYFIFFNLFQKNKYSNICSVKNISGSAFLVNEKTQKTSFIIEGQKLYESSVIKTNKDSMCELNIGNNSIVKIFNYSMLKLAILSKRNNIEKTNIAIKYGEIYFKPSKIIQGSSYKVVTEFFTINVTGTEFFVKVDNDKSKVYVEEGSVAIQSNLEIKEIDNIKKVDPFLADKINDLINKKIIINANEKIEFINNDYKNLNSDILIFFESMKNDLENNKNNKNKISEIIKSAIENIKLLSIRQSNIANKQMIEKSDLQLFINDRSSLLNENPIQNKNGNDNFFLSNKKQIKTENSDDKLLPDEEKIQVKEENFNTLKISTLGLNLTEKNCAITAYNKYIIIASDYDKTIYYINSDNGELIWKFTDKEINTISSCPIAYNNKIIFGTPEALFVLNLEGKLISMTKIENGPIYWPLMLAINNDLYIPTSKKLYQYDGKAFNLVENFPDFLGQIYISSDSKNIYSTFLNEKKNMVYSLKDKKIIWKSNTLKQRSFVHPALCENYIFIGDSIGNIYKFNYEANETEASMIKVDAGIMSNIIYKDNFIYFIANDGYFYRININFNNSFEKLFLVDKNSDPDIYFTKKLLIIDNKIFFNSNTGKIFYYNTVSKNLKFINIKDNNNDFPLIGTPIIFNEYLFSIDTHSNIYRMDINKF